MSPYHRSELPVIPLDDWRTEAVCAQRMGEMLWDDRIPGEESERARAARHREAKAICKTRCPVRAKCAADADWRADEGTIRGGHKLPSLDSHRPKSEEELLHLLRKGYPLDDAARLAG